MSHVRVRFLVILQLQEEPGSGKVQAQVQQKENKHNNGRSTTADLSETLKTATLLLTVTARAEQARLHFRLRSLTRVI